MGGTGRKRAALRSAVLFGAIVVLAIGMLAWKQASAAGAAAAASGEGEHGEVVTAAVAVSREHRGTATSIGTVVALRSITLRNELPGTVRWAALRPGQVVEAGTVLVALDVSVEEAELKALQARVDLAETTLARLQRMAERRAVSAMELDNARAERDVAQAELDRTRAVIARKTIRAPFRARVGISDVHPGQFLDVGTQLTTLQGVEASAYIDFAVAQAVAASLRAGDEVRVEASPEGDAALSARIVAVDSRVDPGTRNATVRAKLDGGGAELVPGASVRVRVSVGDARTAAVIPVSALRKGPGGDHVFVLHEADGLIRAVQRAVQAGAVLGDSVLILAGLEAGERVAAAGSFKLHEGALVYVAPDAAATSVR
jgi:membrane fusion protein, multidrug efflux system